jgi:hypothetical protein
MESNTTQPDHWNYTTYLQLQANLDIGGVGVYFFPFNGAFSRGCYHTEAISKLRDTTLKIKIEKLNS